MLGEIFILVVNVATKKQDLKQAEGKSPMAKPKRLMKAEIHKSNVVVILAEQYEANKPDLAIESTTRN